MIHLNVTDPALAELPEMQAWARECEKILDPIAHRLNDVLAAHGCIALELRPVPAKLPHLDDRGFYEVMYRYRHAPMNNQAEVVARFEAVKEWLRERA